MGKPPLQKAWPRKYRTAIFRDIKNKRIVTLDLAGMVAGAKYRESLRNLKSIMQEIRKAENIILFIDEMHTIIGAGRRKAPLMPPIS